jgi:hypothetical protein
MNGLALYLSDTGVQAPLRHHVACNPEVAWTGSQGGRKGQWRPEESLIVAAQGRLKKAVGVEPKVFLNMAEKADWLA